MNLSGRHYFLAGLCILLFLLAQTFQALASWFWIPASSTPQDSLLIYLLRVDQIRSLLVMGTILLLIVPYAIVALRYLKVAPLASLLGFVFAAAFVGFEISVRSIDFFVVGQRWAPQLKVATPFVRDTILSHFALWNDMVHGWTFPLRLASFLASSAFTVATSNEKIGWYRLGQVAFGLNALRLLGRLFSSYAGQNWLDSLNNSLYFPVVVIINVTLLIWFFFLSGEATGKP